MQIASVYRPKLTESNDYLKYLWKYWSPSYNTSKEEIDEIRNAFTKDNVVDAVTSYYRHLFRPFSLVKSRWPVDFNRVPTLILVGKEDGCMSPRIAELEKEKLKDFPKAEVKILPNAGHFLQREQPEIVAKISIDFSKNILNNICFSVCINHTIIINGGCNISNNIFLSHFIL